MSFQTFRKYEKPLLMAAVVFTVGVFVFFPSFGDVNAALDEGTGDELAGTFTVATTGKTERVSFDRFYRVQRDMARVLRQRGIDDAEVWANLILRADARGAGLEVSDTDLAAGISGLVGGNLTDSTYGQLWRGLGFASARDFEEAVRGLMLADIWRGMLFADATVVDADDVYEQWKAQNELFDFAAAVIPSVDPESVDDPGDEVLREHYESRTPTTRERLFASPAKKDVVYAWRALDAPLEGIDEATLAALTEPTDAEIEARYRLVKPERWPDPPADEPAADDAADADTEGDSDTDSGDDTDDAAADSDEPAAPEGPTDAQREELRRELRNMAVLSAAAAQLRAAVEGPEDAVDKQEFVAVANEWGMQVRDPEGLLGPEELEALEAVGGSRLPSRLRTLGPGELHQLRPFQPDASVAFMVLVEDSLDPEPLAFEEAREMVLENWRSTQRDRDAQAFMDALTQAARELPAAQEALAGILEGVEQRVAQRLEAAPEGESPDEEALRTEELEAAQAEIDAVVQPLRGEVFAEVAAEQGVGLETFEGVSRSYARDPDGDEAADSVARFLKTGGQVFQLEAGQVSRRPAYHAQSENWVVVHVTDTRFPDKAAMLADDEGMQAARTAAERTAGQLFQLELYPAAIQQSHELKVPQPEGEAGDEADGASGGSPAGS